MLPNQINPAQSLAPGAPGTFRVPNLLDNENVESYGLADNFVATMAAIRTVPYDFNYLARQQRAREGKGKAPENKPGYSLCVAIYFDPDGADSKLEPSYYPSGMPLYHFVPSPDGINPAGPKPGPDGRPTTAELWEGYAALAAGKIHILHDGSTDANSIPYTDEDIAIYSGLFAAPVGGYNADGTTKHGHKGMDPKSDWMTFLNTVGQCAKVAGTPIDMRALAAAYSTHGFAAFEGHRGRFNRLPRPGSSDPTKKILVMTEYLGFKGTGAVGQSSQSQPALMQQAIQPAQAQAPNQAQPAGDNGARVYTSVDPVDIYIRNSLAAAGGKLPVTVLLTGVTAQGSPFFGDQISTSNAFAKIMAPGGQLLIAAGFAFNPQTGEVSLPSA